MAATLVYSVVGKELRESKGLLVDGILVNYMVEGRSLFHLSRQEAVRDAIRYESSMEAQCDVLISRIKDELREARREGAAPEVVDTHEFNIATISRRREGHCENKAALTQML